MTADTVEAFFDEYDFGPDGETEDGEAGIIFQHFDPSTMTVCFTTPDDDAKWEGLAAKAMAALQREHPDLASLKHEVVEI